MGPENSMPERSEHTSEAGAEQRGTLENKAPRPAGLLPKNTQQLVILGVAVVMILILWLGGGAKGKRTESPPLVSSDPVEPPNPASVEAFRRSIEQQQQEARKPISQANLERLRALGLAGDVPAGSAVVPPAEASVPRTGDVVGSAAGEPSAPPDPIEEDKRKREYLSLFAPNVAFSYRPGLESGRTGDPESQVPSPLAQTLSAQQRNSNPGPGGPAAGSVMPAEPELPLSSAEERAPSARQPALSNPDVSRPGAFNSSTGRRYVVFEGTILETVLINRLNGTFSGPVNCLVTTDLYSHDRRHILIPAGTRVLGEAKKVDAFGQQRLAVFFHRLIMPDGYSVSLDEFKGLSQTGETALRDEVNNHYLEIFGSSLAVGVLAGVAEAGTGNVLTNSPLDRAREGFGASLANSSMNILDRFLNLLPTVTIREGYRVKVYLSGDLLLPDYARHTMPPDL